MGLFSLKLDSKDLSRLRRIVTILMKQGFHDVVNKAKLTRLAKLSIRVNAEPRETTPARVRETLEKLGPTFVKMGQVLSLRPDLIPQQYCDEFRKLQDDVPPLPFSVIKGVIESELKQPLHSLFKRVKEHPLAVASIAQVHEARLKTGERVAIKVQRPGVRNVIRRDIDILLFLTPHLEKAYPTIPFSEIFAVFEEYAEKELDLTIESQALNQSSTFFEPSEKVLIPKAHPEYSTPNILVREWQEHEMSKRNLAVICAAFFIGSAFIAGLAAQLTWFDFPLYQLGFLLFLVTLLMFIIVSIKTPKCVEKETGR